MKKTLIASLFILYIAGLQSVYASKSESTPKPKSEATPKSKSKSTPPATAESEQPKLYIKLDPPLVVNVDEGDVIRFLQIDAQLQFAQLQAQAIIEKHMPAIRDALIMQLSSQSVTEIKTPQGKEKLRASTLKAVQQVMTDVTGEPVIDAIYFTGFVIQ